MTRRASVTLLVVLLGTAGVAALGFGDSPRSRARRRQREAQARFEERFGPVGVQPKLPIPGHVPVPVEGPAHPARTPQEEMKALPTRFSLYPQFDRLKGEARRVPEGLAGLLSKDAAVPDHRVDHFRWLHDRQQYTVTGWNAIIEEVVPVAGGHMVSARVRPTLRAGGSSAATLDHIIERYLVVDGKARFAGAVEVSGTHQGVEVTD